MSAEPIYLEKLDSYLVDQFHHGLLEVTGGLWGDVLHGHWYCHLDFFKSLRSHYDQVIDLRDMPRQLQSHLEYLNFSGRPGSTGGLGKEFAQSWIPIWRQRIFFLTVVGLLLKHRVTEDENLGVAECGPSENEESLIGRADDNLYKAKERGKNRVVSGRLIL